MVETFFDNRLASGYDNIAGLTNWEGVKISGFYFAPVVNLGVWSEGTAHLRGDGVTISNGYPSFSWQSAYLSFEQWHYLYSNVLGSNRSGKVTVKT